MARTSNNGGDSKAPKAPATPKAPARRRSDKVRQTTAASDALTAQPGATTRTKGANGRPNEAEVALLAYELYVQRGCCDGYDKDDWYEAERRLRQQR